MLSFFTDPYPNELLYSVCARYHFYSGNVDFKDTLMELFGKNSVIPTFEIGNHLQFFCDALSEVYTPEYFIKQHTIFPFYTPFLPKNRNTEIQQEIILGNGQGIYTKLGIIAGSICSKKAIYYCPMCAATEIEKLGEPYIHREHQLQGVLVCPQHGCDLKSYSVEMGSCSRIEYIRLEEKMLDFSVTNLYRVQFNGFLFKIAQAANYLLTHHFPLISKKEVLGLYKNLLYKRDLLTSKMRVRQKELHDLVVGYYGKALLEFLESSIDNRDEYNWLRVATRNIPRTVHPLRHILLILCLTEDLNIFFKGIAKPYNPFGAGPWPCLNQAAEHYRQNVVKQVIITADSKTRKPVGTFTCNCGYCYSRTGPDQVEQDQYRKGRVKTFGLVWETKLHKLLRDKCLSYRQMAKELGCDVKTVQKFEIKINHEQTIKKQDISDMQFKGNQQCLTKYKNLFQRIIQEKPELSRTEIRKAYSKEYMFLYRHNYTWLMDNLPPHKTSLKSLGYVNWPQRDKNIINQLQQAYDELIHRKKFIRISKSSLGKHIGQLPMLEKHIDKLPLCQKYIEDVIENTQQFQIRRCQQIIKAMKAEAVPLVEWKIWRKAGLRHEDYKLIKNRLQWNSRQGGR